MNSGPHQANAPVTNATHVKPRVDSINDLFLEISAKTKTAQVNPHALAGNILLFHICQQLLGQSDKYENFGRQNILRTNQIVLV